LTYIDEELLARAIGDMIQLPVVAQQLGKTEVVEVRVLGIDRPHGFAVHVQVGLQVVAAELHWDNFAKDLLDAISLSTSAAWSQLQSDRQALTSVNVSSALSINGVAIGADENVVTNAVADLALSARGVGWHETPSENAAELATAVLSILLGLLPIDSGETPEFEVEGRQHRYLTNSFERSRSNRAIAILLHGTDCAVCGFSFGSTYGDVGKGYIEIHHLTPVHLMAAPRTVDPASELAPLCANCHRMAHRVDPPYAIEQLKEIRRKS
jgi:5-methylcytosine-specific restriction protein A